MTLISFQEISSLKDEGPGASGQTASGLEVIPPLLTSLPPKHVMTSQSQQQRSSVMMTSHDMLSGHSHGHLMTGGIGSALSPSFSPALSPLATRSPSISPVVVGPLVGTPRGPARGVTRGAQQPPTRYSSQANSIHSDYVEAAEKELRI